jgi:hypothetical protein
MNPALRETGADALGFAAASAPVVKLCYEP